MEILATTDNAFLIACVENISCDCRAVAVSNDYIISLCAAAGVHDSVGTEPTPPDLLCNGIDRIRAIEHVRVF